MTSFPIKSAGSQRRPGYTTNLLLNDKKTTHILNNPFDDIKPRNAEIKPVEVKVDDGTKKKKSKGIDALDSNKTKDNELGYMSTPEIVIPYINILIQFLVKYVVRFFGFD